MARPKIGMTAKKKQAAAMLGQGIKREVVASRLNVALGTISKWTQDDEFVQYVLKESDRQLAMTVPKARAVVTVQLDDGNGWLAQGAARIVMQEHRELQGEGAQQVIIHFAGDDTAPGLPVNDGMPVPDDGPDDE